MAQGRNETGAQKSTSVRSSLLKRHTFLKVLRNIRKLRPRRRSKKPKDLESLRALNRPLRASVEINVSNICEYVSRIYPENLPAWLSSITTSDCEIREYIGQGFLYIGDAERHLIREIDAVPGHSHSQHISRLEQNIRQNRYHNILPYESSRILLSNPNISSGNYVNASRVGGFLGIPSIIATQGPLPNTVEAFWCLIWEQNVYVILMIVQNDMFGSPRMCHKYWPSPDSRMEFENSKVVLLPLSEKYVEEHEIYIRKFEISVQMPDGSKLSRSVVQIQYVGWIDFGISTAEKVLYVYDLVNAMISKCPSDCEVSGNAGVGHPHNLAIHCSAGCGRTGTFIAIYSVLELMKSAKLHGVKDLSYSLLSPTDKSEAKVKDILRRTIVTHKQRSIFDSSPFSQVVIDPLGGYFDIVFVVVLALRSQRVSMVFAAQQYALIYETVALRIFQWQSQTPIDFPSWIKRYTQASLMQVSETSWSKLAANTLLTPEKSGAV